MRNAISQCGTAPRAPRWHSPTLTASNGDRVDAGPSVLAQLITTLAVWVLLDAELAVC